MFKKPFDSDTIARNVHDWLRAKDILDEDHDLPYATTPAQYRSELVAAVEGRFSKELPEEPPGNVVSIAGRDG